MTDTGPTTATSSEVRCVWDLPILPQRQDSLRAQLLDLHFAANRLGMRDAADWLNGQMVTHLSGDAT